MKRTLTWLLVFLLAFGMAAATAESNNVMFALTPGPQGVMLMDENSRTISTFLSSGESGGIVYWTLLVEDSDWQTATLYTRDANSNWLNSNMTFDRAQLISGGNTVLIVVDNRATQGGAGNGGAAAGDNAAARPWPVYDRMDTYGVSVIPLGDEQRVPSYCGPNRHYHGAGAYLTYKFITSSALFIENGYMLVDLEYLTVGRRRVYFKASAFNGTGNVPNETLNGYDARTTADLTPFFGPGWDYDEFTEALISSGTQVQVFFEENGWVFAEFSCALGNVRAWILVDQLSW